MTTANSGTARLSPADWNPAALAHWRAGQRASAINAVLAALNQAGSPAPDALVLQLAYYVFLIGDPAGAAGFLRRQWADRPVNAEVLLNLVVCLSRSGQVDEALARAQEFQARFPDDAVLHDALCSILSRLGRFDEARREGTQALVLKHAAAGPPPQGWGLPQGHTAASWVGQPGKQPVIAFSLWGANPRYLHGALHNLLAARQHYPGWTLRFYVDDTVPVAWQQQITRLQGQVVQQAPGQSTLQRLAWRFQVANDPQVGYFLVRDVDSVLSARERRAVDAFMASGSWFHVMRDWWTHTDLMLAGMWGGVAGVLPDMKTLLRAYRPATMETPNIDQWFLRDVVWPYVAPHCLMHDRCFGMPGAQPWPDPDPPGQTHVGQDEHGARPAAQLALITPYLPAGLQPVPAPAPGATGSTAA